MGSELMVAGVAAASIIFVGTGAGSSAVFLSTLRLERLRGSRSAVELRFILSWPARVRFLVIGPAPSCRVAGRFVLAGQKGLNKVAFRGRVRGRRLEPGVYTIVPQIVAGSRRLPRAVAVAVDERGIRPTAPVRWRNCYTAAVAPSFVLPPGNAFSASALRASGIAAAEAITSATRKRTAEENPFPVFGLLPSIPKSPQLSALLLGLLAASIALLSLASVEPGHMLRFQTVRVLASHRGQIACLGGALLVIAILLSLMQ
jgi:hypothetical protein